MWTLLWVIEGIGNYGAELTKAVQGTGYTLVEAAWMSNKTPRGIGKRIPSMPSVLSLRLLPFSIDRLRKICGNNGAGKLANYPSNPKRTVIEDAYSANIIQSATASVLKSLRSHIHMCKSWVT